jgi:hypothetical protein
MPRETGVCSAGGLAAGPQRPAPRTERYAFAGRHHCFAVIEHGFPKVLAAKSYFLNFLNEVQRFWN